MKNLFFIFLFTFLSITESLAQVQDDFSNTDLTSDPAWLGDLSLFMVNDGQLQLMDNDPGSSNTSVLFTQANTSLAQLTTWRFSVQLDFSPSTSNFARAVLSTAPEVSIGTGAYFVQIGGISGSNDAIDFYKLNTDGSQEKLISGTLGGAGSAPVIAAIELTRSTEGLWTLGVDYNGGNNYQVEGTATDVTFGDLTHFGFFCRYTSSRNDLFFFDNVFIDPIFSDQIAPELLSVDAFAADSIRLIFSEPIADASLLPENFVINQGIGPVGLFLANPEESNTIIALLNKPLTNLTNYEISIQNISDEAGNISPPITQAFQFFQTSRPAIGDLIISEFMANPNGAAGIPNFEYIELYNASQKALDLSEVGIASGGSPRLLPESVLLPGEFLIVTNANNSAQFLPFGKVVGVPSLPTLSNGGDVITVGLLEEGIILQNILYDLSWYQDNDKSDGGFSIERIFSNQPANCPGNWQASLSPDGGTPGQANSVADITAEAIPPVIGAAFVANSSQIKLSFNETLGALMGMTGIYQLSPNIEILSAEISGPRLDSVTLQLADVIVPGTVYTLTIEQAEDCLGNFQDNPQQVQLAVPQTIAFGDLQLNEILFNPQSGGSDFIELVNTSNKVISLNGLQIINRLRSSGNNQTRIEFEQLLLPGQYLAITPDINDITRDYPLPAEANIIEADLPTLSSDEGNLTLVINDLELQSFDYSDELHSSLLRNDRGVSLERLSLSLDINAPNNWASAAASTGFATPGYPNSQVITTSAAQEDLFFLERETFSPDGDAFEDILVLNYQTDQAGYLANIRVFDASGRPVTTLARNESLASEGILTWDGSNEEGQKARIGVYVIWLEVFTPDGDKRVEKLTCVLAGRF